ncbi:MAG: ATP-binding cassette domain-containing protein [Gammaproteobacteria bacterium]|nr:ATP-binding cassette domain-containing protein [Gammaproteobacteria bacterium]
MLQFIDVTLRRGERILFDDLSLTVHAGHKAGVVGRNGVGKSTLFELVRRRLLPEAGDVVWPESWRLACLEQSVEPSARAALDFVLDGDTRLRRVERAIAKAERTGDDEALGHLYSDLDDAGGYDAHARAGEILSGLGFAAADFTKPHGSFSGGWRISLNLARALMTPSDLLLLDEPTNHLDLDATLWLENWVRRYEGTLLLIAHDRDFLDRAMGEIVHLDDGKAKAYSGNYAAFERQRAEALERQAAIYKKQQRRVAEIHAFVDRFRAKASKARQAQSRLKELERMDLVAPVHAELPYRFDFTQPKKISNPTLMLDDAAIGYHGHAVLDDVTLRVYPNDRIGVLGANGAGKTTLLRCLAGELAPMAGTSSRGQHAAVGYFAQHQLESLDLDASPRDHFADPEADDMPAWSDQHVRDYLGGWGFRGDDVNRRARTFSGGEKARLVLALLACRRPAVLVLDEPTNHLDLEMRQALAIALQEYQGAVLLVSHDRHLLRQCADDFWLVADGTVGRFRDDLDAYTALRRKRTSAEPRQAAGRAPRTRPGDRRSLSREQVRLERRLEQLTHRLEAIDSSLGARELHRRPDEIARLVAERREVAREVASAEVTWLALQGELDRLD